MNPPAVPPATRSRRHWMPALVLGLGAGSLLLLVGNNGIQQRLIAPDIGGLRAVAEIQTRMAIAHLWIEEYVTGDAVDLGEIDKSLARADRLANSLEERFANSLSNERRTAPKKEIRRLTEDAVAGIDDFAQLTRERQAAASAGDDVGIGSAMDIEYDRVFARLNNDLGALEQALVLRLATSERRARVLLRGLVIAWSLIVALAAVALWTQERRQRRAEAALGASQAQLLQAQKMEAVGQLAGGLAHDINNYLAAIAAQCELVRIKAEPSGTTAKRMDSVLATIGRASALIERLLAFSRRQPARPEPVDVNRVLESMDGMLRQLLGEDVKLETRLTRPLWPVEIDVSQLEQIILNLAVNAREAMTTGGGLTLETRNVPSKPGSRKRSRAPSDRVELAVSDTGGGIPRALHRRIFDPFFTTKETAHSGLGLATVLGVVEQNGGVVTVDSNKSGTRFSILLPRSSQAPPAVPTAEAESETSAGNGERILLVEDNDELRHSTHDLLETWGYRVVAAGDAELALELFEDRNGEFDLLITDVVMPGMSGRQLAETLQGNAPELSILYISGHTDDVVLRHGLEAGSVDLLPKPFSAAELARRVGSALAPGSANRE